MQACLPKRAYPEGLCIEIDQKTHYHEPFSKILAEILEYLPPKGLTFQELFLSLGLRGQLALCMVLTVPFLLPVSIPGSSVPFGLVICIIAIRAIRDKPLQLPEKYANQLIGRKYLQFVLKRAIKIFSYLEKFSRPRLLVLTTGVFSQIVNGTIMLLVSVMLMFPLPIPFSNTLPAYAVLFLAAGNLERDGFIMLAGYLMTFFSVTYFSILFFMGTEGLIALFPWLF
ncbi:MAG: exopolysaccharide biosynthesis protein [Peptococcaceae bacterium]|nr:exopolysaccharide biosynthesis protein [Peptococcaceae bacterium]